MRPAPESGGDGAAARAARQTVWDAVWRAHRASAAVSHELLLDAIAAHAGQPGGRRVLEVGAGSAGDSLALAWGGDHCVAVDYSPAALEHARAQSRLIGAPLHLVRADAATLPFRTGAFRVVFSQGLLEHFADPEPYLEEQVRSLDPFGILVVDVPQRWSAYTLWKHWLMARGAWFAGWETEFSLSELERLVERAGGRAVGSYGYGYFPSLLLGIRNLHTFDVRRGTRWRVPARLRAAIETVWTTLERWRPYYGLLANVGVVARRAGPDRG